MEKMMASEVAKAVNGLLYGESEILTVTTDSRKAQSGALFVALKGENFDGNDYVANAADAGAAAVLCSVAGVQKATGKDGKCAVIKVQNTGRALLELAAHYKNKFCVKTVAVTGSVGKTTTKEFIHSVLQSYYKTLKTKGNFNNEIGLPLTVFELSREHQVAVLEMGMSGFGEISRMSAVAKPDIGVITNIGISHIEKLGSQENILKAKLEICDGMPDNGLLVLNGDDAYLKSLQGKLERRCLYYAIDNPDADIRAENIVQHADSCTFDVQYKQERATAEIETVGLHNVYNALAAVLCGILCGISLQKAVDALKCFKNAANRQNIYEHRGIKIVDDCYNASPDSMKATLSVLKEMEVRGHKIAVLADMLELGDYAEEAHLEIGAFVAKSDVDILFAYGKNAIHYGEGAVEGGMDHDSVVCFDSKEDLWQALSETAEQGDAVLFKGSRGMKLEEAINCFLKEIGK